MGAQCSRVRRCCRCSLRRRSSRSERKSSKEAADKASGEKTHDEDAAETSGGFFSCCCRSRSGFEQHHHATKEDRYRVACSIGKVHQVTRFLDRENVDIDCATPVLHYRAIHAAAGHGKLGVLESLIKRRVEVNAQTAQGMTALHLAAINGHTEAVKVLLQARANHQARVVSLRPVVGRADRELKDAYTLALEANRDDIVDILRPLLEADKRRQEERLAQDQRDDSGMAKDSSASSVQDDNSEAEAKPRMRRSLPGPPPQR
eukprot:TRINITY_DN22296_c0_g1_i2.p1 TRINITY_DN22296_c0_g1~~TRINITY_DN22296_c0_g1_i2.p1  ORF type:complete len:261 (-),score=44.36 TRINITY_DN22296_c0_g1_i2:174-956(-)